MWNHSNFLLWLRRINNQPSSGGALQLEEREQFCSEVAAHNCGDAIVNSKKEADKIIRYLVDNIRLTSDLML